MPRSEDKDARLFMTFPNSFPWHPKITRLSVAARWAFVEMNGYSRVRDLDGVIPAEDAEFEWGQAVLDELVGSHPSRPLVIRDGDSYVIREYAKHQQTKADREKISADKSRAGKAGAEARWGSSKPMAPAKQLSSGAMAADSQSLESRVQSPEGQTYVTESLSGNTPPDAGTDSTSRSILKGRGISPDRLITHIKARTGLDVTATSAMKVALNILDRAGQVKTTDQQYVLGSISRSPAETQKFIHENGLAR